MPAVLPQTVPTLRFGAEPPFAADHVAAPTLRFPISIEAGGGGGEGAGAAAGAGDGEAIRSILLDLQIQIAARRRGYNGAETGRLLELFGTPERWGSTLRTLLWTRTTAVVPPFTGATVIEVDIPCSYDLEITASRYFAALEEGEIPLELLFSGTVFFTGADGRLQAARIPWDHEVEQRLPVAVWRVAIDRHFPGAAWLRIGRPAFDRLYAYKARHAFKSWDAAIETLLEGGDD